MSDETWRVVLSDGSVRAVAIDEGAGPPWWAEAAPVDGRGRFGPPGDSPLAAVLLLAEVRRWPVCEIRCPGELTTAEQVAAARTALIAEVAASRSAYELVMCGGHMIDDIVRRLRDEDESAMPEGGVF
jgi:hypothetical protein